jgi:adenylyl cyclase-associated protein
MGLRICECTVLIRLVRRLEAATSRLEDIAQATIDPSAATNGSLAVPAPGAPPIGQGAQSAPLPSLQAPPPPEPLPQAIEDFGGLINKDVQKYVSLSEGLGGLLAEQARL